MEISEFVNRDRYAIYTDSVNMTPNATSLKVHEILKRFRELNVDVSELLKQSTKQYADIGTLSNQFNTLSEKIDFTNTVLKYTLAVVGGIAIGKLAHELIFKPKLSADTTTHKSTCFKCGKESDSVKKDGVWYSWCFTCRYVKNNVTDFEIRNTGVVCANDHDHTHVAVIGPVKPRDKQPSYVALGANGYTSDTVEYFYFRKTCMRCWQKDLDDAAALLKYDPDSIKFMTLPDGSAMIPPLRIKERKWWQLW